MKFSILIFFANYIFGLIWVEAAKTVTISSPSCNLSAIVEIPTSECCCPAPTTIGPVTPVEPTLPPTTNKRGCLTFRMHGPPRCVVSGTRMYRGKACNTYYQCTGRGTASHKTCEGGQTFSAKQQTCVPLNSRCCVD